jgi:hypothetical protein
MKMTTQLGLLRNLMDLQQHSSIYTINTMYNFTLSQADSESIGNFVRRKKSEIYVSIQFILAKKLCFAFIQIQKTFNYLLYSYNISSYYITSVFK